MGTVAVTKSKTSESDSIVTTGLKGVMAPFNYDETYNYQRGEFIALGVACFLGGYSVGAMRGEKVASGAAAYAIPQLRLG